MTLYAKSDEPVDEYEPISAAPSPFPPLLWFLSALVPLPLAPGRLRLAACSLAFARLLFAPFGPRVFVFGTWQLALGRLPSGYFFLQSGIKV